MTKILRVSRHEPVEAEIRRIYELFGRDVYIHQLNLRIGTAEELAEYIVRNGFNYVLPVLPLSFLKRLAEIQDEYGFKVLYSKYNLLHIDSNGFCGEYNPMTDTLVETRDSSGRLFYRHFRFEDIYHLKSVEINLEPIHK